ncbi:MAG: RNA methyltransferase [Prevotella sp.]|nr:RNA methyltransferase [Prevotella sp.]
MISKNQLKFVHQLELKKHRRSEQAFVAEGPKVVGDLLDSGFTPLQIFATDGWCDGRRDKSQRVSDDELRRLSFLQHPQDVLAVFRLPEVPKETPAGGLQLALDGVQDPGNLGTIIRIADWFGIDTVYCSEDTADAWSPKVVQATMGSIARVNIIYTKLTELIATAHVPVYGTLLDGRNLYEEPLSADGIIVMGNEGNGISQEVRQLITHRLLIPRYHEGPESLNVAIATAITCAEFRRRM